MDHWNRWFSSENLHSVRGFPIAMVDDTGRYMEKWNSCSKNGLPSDRRQWRFCLTWGSAPHAGRTLSGWWYTCVQIEASVPLWVALFYYDVIDKCYVLMFWSIQIAMLWISKYICVPNLLMMAGRNFEAEIHPFSMNVQCPHQWLSRYARVKQPGWEYLTCRLPYNGFKVYPLVILTLCYWT